MLNCNYAFEVKLMHSFKKQFEPSFTYKYHNLVVVYVEEILYKYLNESMENVKQLY